MILVCGGLADGVTELVCARLAHCGLPFRLLDLASYPTGHRLAWTWGADGPEGWIETGDWRLDLTDLTGVYLRFLGPEGRRPVEGAPEDDLAALRAEGDAGLAALAETLPCLVVNRISGGLANNSKPWQAATLAECGLAPPATIVTNDPDAARAFWEERRGAVVYKSASGVRSIVRRLEADDLDRLARLVDGPAQLQAYVPGVNVRTHVVGARIFATEIESGAAVDYRYAHLDGEEVAMTPIRLPDEIAEACLRAARAFDLVLAGIDLKRTPEGEWFCFEVNPCPGFLYYERHSGQPISAALADLLAAGAAGCRP